MYIHLVTATAAAAAAAVAHEIKNPLTSIRSAVETLEMAPPNSPIRDKLMAILKSDVRRMDRLITDISNASRLDAELSREAPKGLALDRLLLDIVSTYAAEHRPGQADVRLVAAEGLDQVWVSGRETQFGQVFRNLIDNARSFSPADQDVVVTLTREPADRGGRGNAVVWVEDSGPGIPPENLETVFERFYTSRPKGQAFGGNSGLGLSIARQIVEAHGGVIRAENRLSATQAGEGENQVLGARFIVSLPEVAG